MYFRQIGTYRVSVAVKEISATWKGKNGRDESIRGTVEQVLSKLPADAEFVVLTERLHRNEAFVTISQPSDVAPVGSGLELGFVETGASTFRVKGNASRFVLLIDGKPAAKVLVTVTRGGMQWRDRVEAREFITDTAGQFSVDWPEAGFYLLDAQAIDDKTTIPKANERILTYTATFEVLPLRPTPPVIKRHVQP
ncbi:DUF4198 domain-containing protein [Cupriavidus basilensis]|nr:DUF4198 domain-containing protein [Cupriavidus basilensis]NUA30897.1 DUF4198 domain-containing protein [Cupriavidus basilensis]